MEPSTQRVQALVTALFKVVHILFPVPLQGACVCTADEPHRILHFRPHEVLLCHRFLQEDRAGPAPEVAALHHLHAAFHRPADARRDRVSLSGPPGPHRAHWCPITLICVLCHRLWWFPGLQLRAWGQCRPPSQDPHPIDLLQGFRHRCGSEAQ